MKAEIKLNYPEWLTEIITKPKLDELYKLAGLNFTPEMVANYFSINEEEFMHWFKMHNSQLKKEYDRGILIFSGKEGSEMIKGANAGNATQGQRLDKFRYQLKFDQLKDRIIYGKE